MDDSYQGVWEIPDNGDDEHQKYGTLKCSSTEGIYLQVLYALDEELFSFRKFFERIYGTTGDDTQITLERCAKSGRNEKFQEGSMWVASEGYQAERAYIGDHNQGRETNFDKIVVDFSFLKQWYDISGFKGVHDSPEIEDATRLGDADVGDQQYIIYEIPEPVTASIENLSTKTIISQNSDSTGERAEESISLELKKSDDKSYSAYHDDILTLQNFFTLTLDEPVLPTQIKGSSDSESVNIVSDLITSSPDKEEPTYQNVDFGINSLEEGYQTALENWFESADYIKPVHDLYFSIRRSDDMYLNNVFLSTVRAAEIYHRRVVGGTYIPEDEFKEYRDELQEDIPSNYSHQFTQHLKGGSFKYANELSLKIRLEELLEEKFHDELEVLPVDVNGKARPISTLRNHMIHYDEDEDEIDIEDLHTYNEILKSLIEVCLLSEIEIATDNIQERIERKYSPRFTIH